MGVSQATRSANSDLAWSILNALDVHVAVLDKDGVIVHTNRTWDEFAARNPREDGSVPLHVGVGTNYLSVCRSAVGSSAENAFAAYRGIKDVLAGKKRHFVLEYPCHSSQEQRWFVMKVTPLKGTRPRQVAVVHTNVTAQKQAEFEIHHKTQDLAQALASLESFTQQLKTTFSLDQSIRAAKLNVTATKPSGGPDYGTEEKARLKLLSKREREVLTALARGERVGDIARRMSLSAKSVSTYRSRVLEKLQIRTTTDLVTFMTRIGAL